MTKKYFTFEEAAEYLRMPEGTLRKHLPEIRRSRLGKRLIFSQEALDEYVESRQSKPVHELQSA